MFARDFRLYQIQLIRLCNVGQGSSRGSYPELRRCNVGHGFLGHILWFPQKCCEMLTKEIQTFYVNVNLAV